MSQDMRTIDITPAQRKTILELLKIHIPHTQVWAYGSRVKWTSKPTSDLDLVVFAGNKQRLAISNLKEAFEDSNLPFQVDLFIWNEVPETFRRNIEAEHVVLQEEEYRIMATKPEPIFGKLPNKWQLTTVGNLIDLNIAELQTGPFGTMLHASSYVKDGIPVIAVKNIGNNWLNNEQIPYVDDKTSKLLHKYKVQTGDIIFGRKGAIDRRALIRNKEEGWIQGSDCIRLRFLGNSIIPKFISYVLGTPNYRSWIISNAQGATMPSLNQEIIKRIPIPLAPLIEQRAIAHILGTLDDKIELNRRMNETLEAMAQAIFKSWFVDFDPVIDNAIKAGNPIPESLTEKAKHRKEALAKTKSEGRNPGLPPDIAGLFPDSFVESELGMIPKGWRILFLKDYGKIVTGKTPPTKEKRYFGNKMPFITPRDMDGKIFIAQTDRYLSNDGVELLLKSIIPAKSILVSCIGSDMGKVSVNSESSITNQQINSIILDDNTLFEYLFLNLKRRKNEFQNLAGGGSAQPILNKTQFSILKTANPSREIVKQFCMFVSTKFFKIEQNYRQSRILSNLRNSLLPKLLSGELQVKNTEMYLEMNAL